MQVAVSAAAGQDSSGLEDEGSWAQVGKRNRVAVTRTSGLGGDGVAEGKPRTAIEALFSGATKSLIKVQNAKVGWLCACSERSAQRCCASQMLQHGAHGSCKPCCACFLVGWLVGLLHPRIRLTTRGTRLILGGV